jgi:phosphoglycolate phosphatase
MVFRWPFHDTTWAAPAPRPTVEAADRTMALVVFDLDGTLVDSRRDLADSVNEMLGDFGATPQPIDEVARMVGEGARVLVRRALAAARLEVDADAALATFRAIYDRRLLIHTRPYDGIPELVREAAVRGPLAVLTNKPEAPSHRLLDAFDLASSFRRVIGGDSDFARKPDPAGLQALMAEFGATPATTLFVGDSMIDVETARRAGTRVCVALYGFGGAGGEALRAGTECAVGTPHEAGVVLASFVRPSTS